MQPVFVEMYSSTKCIVAYGLASQLLGKVVQTN